jgi:PAS domain S-box-containing protein
MSSSSQPHNDIAKENLVLKALIDGVKGVHLAYLDRDFNFVQVNQAFAQTCGCRPEELVRKNYFVLYPNEESEAVFKRVRDTGLAEHFHNKPFVFSGQPERGVTYWDWTLEPVKDADRTVTGLVFSFIETTESKKTKEALAQVTNELTAVLENIDLGFVSLDNNWCFLYVNNRAARNVGYDAKSLIGKNIWKTFPKLVGKEVETYYHQAMENHTTMNFQTHGVLTDRWYDEKVYPTSEGIAIFWDDITERKKWEEATKRQADLIDLSPDAIIVMTPVGDVTFWSLGAEKLYGWSDKEIIGRQIDSLLQTKSPKPVSEIIAELKLVGFWSGELIQCTKDGKEIVVQSTWLPRFDDTGQMVEVLKSNADITARKQDEKKLKQYSENLEALVEKRTNCLEQVSSYSRSLIEASLDPLVTISPEGKITDVNKATESVTGYSREELIGTDFCNYFTEPSKAREGYKTAFTAGFVKDYPLIIRSRTGVVTDVLYNATVFKNRAGEIQGVFAAARDVTQRKKLEKQLQDAERLAAIGATAGMVGHDLRNPLQTIIGQVYLAKSEITTMPDGEQKSLLQESLQTVDEQIGYMDKIVSDLQTFVRPVIVRKQAIQLKQLVKAVLTQVNVPRGIQVIVDVAEDLKVTADPELMRRVLINLVTNAQQAMPEGGKLTVTANYQNQHTTITVSDTGVGISEKIKDRIFQPLFTTKSKGQGFGLAVCRRVMEAQGGTITFESREGQGTQFVINLTE